MYLDTSWEISPPFCVGREINPIAAVAERGTLLVITRHGDSRPGGAVPTVSFLQPFLSWFRWGDVHLNDAPSVVLYL